MVAPIAMPATDSPFIAEITTISKIVPIARPPLNRPDPDMEHLVEIVGDLAFRQHVAHEDEHRQRQQRVPFHQLDRLP
jgi:hypothetical protein